MGRKEAKFAWVKSLELDRTPTLLFVLVGRVCGVYPRVILDSERHLTIRGGQLSKLQVDCCRFLFCLTVSIQFMPSPLDGSVNASTYSLRGGAAKPNAVEETMRTWRYDASLQR